jgi:hypothetical protein
MKECTKCGITKFYTDFYPHNRNKSGYRSECKSCSNKSYKKPKAPVDVPIIDTIGVRKCIRCLETKSLKNFNTERGGGSCCKKCMWTIGSLSGISNKGISLDQFIKMEKDQNNQCYICKRSYEPKNGRQRRLSIDHDHSCCPGQKSCGKCVRGLLCISCNHALGQVNDDIKILKNMIDYLNKK